MEAKQGLVVRKLRNCPAWNGDWADPDAVASGCLEDFLERHGETSVYILDGIELEEVAAALSAARGVVDPFHCIVLDLEALGIAVEQDSNGDTGSARVNERHAFFRTESVGSVRSLTFAAYQHVKDAEPGSTTQPGLKIVPSGDIARRSATLVAASELVATQRQDRPPMKLPTWESFLADVEREIEKQERLAAEKAARATKAGDRASKR